MRVMGLPGERIQFRGGVAPAANLVLVATDDHDLRVPEVFLEGRQQCDVAMRIFVHRTPGCPKRAPGRVEIACLAQQEPEALQGESGDPVT